MASPDAPTDPIALAAEQWTAHGWGDAALGMTMVTSVMRVQQILMQRVDVVLRPLDLTFARYEILMLLSFSRTGALPMRRLGSRLQVHPTSVTSAVDRLEAQGFVERRAHPTDRRAVLATITESGRAIAGRATEVMNEQVFCRPGLSNPKLESLTELLAEMRGQAGDF